MHSVRSSSMKFLAFCSNENNTHGGTPRYILGTVQSIESASSQSNLHCIPSTRNTMSGWRIWATIRVGVVCTQIQRPVDVAPLLTIPTTMEDQREEAQQRTVASNASLSFRRKDNCTYAYKRKRQCWSFRLWYDRRLNI